MVPYAVTVQPLSVATLEYGGVAVIVVEATVCDTDTV